VTVRRSTIQSLLAFIGLRGPAVENHFSVQQALRKIRPPPLTAGTTGNDPAASDLIGQELHLLAGPSPAVWHGAIQSVSTKPRRQSTLLTLGLRLSFQMSLNVLVTSHQRELFQIR
jgi:hypothetical protein